jgi:hypothetical protein
MSRSTRTTTPVADAPAADAPAQPDPDAAATAHVTLAQPGEPTDATPTGRRAQAAQALAATRKRELTLAKGCEWHDVLDGKGARLGRVGVTVTTNAATGATLEYASWEPVVGRAQGIPLYALFPLMDTGDLD